MNASIRSPGPNGGSPHIIRTSTSLTSSSRVMPKRSQTSSTVASGLAITHGTKTRMRLRRSVVRSAGMARFPLGQRAQSRDHRVAKLGRLERNGSVGEAGDPPRERVHLGGNRQLERNPAVVGLPDAARARPALGPPRRIGRERDARGALGLAFPRAVGNAERATGRRLEVGPAAGRRLDRPGHARELEVAHGVARAVVAGEVPRPAVIQAVRLHLALLRFPAAARAVREAHALARDDRVEQHGDVPVEGHTGQQPAGRARLGDAGPDRQLEQPERAVRSPSPRLGCERECGELVGRETGIVEERLTAPDPVAGLAPRVDVFLLDDEAEIAHVVLVAFEHPMERVVRVIAVVRDLLADLVDRERAARVEQQRNQVQQALDLVASGHDRPSLLPLSVAGRVVRPRAAGYVIMETIRSSIRRGVAMCGVAGFWGPPDRGLLEAMARVQAHRGPDDDGFFETEHASLGFRRLSIIDLTHGAQPMGNEDGRVQIVFNGEVYNFRELRAQLEAAGHTFKTDSDTEAIVHAYEEWGPECFTRFNGMWAVGILDLRETPRLVLARDHFGIKPLHWARAGERVLFASEIKAILQDGSFQTQPNEQMLYEYLIWGLHDHTGGTFFEGVNQVRAATYVEIDASGVREHTYWTPSLGTDAQPDPAEFRRLFERSVERRLVADVPVGTCLSGGLDSSSIVSTMTKMLKDHVPDSVSLGDPLKIFTAVFDGDPIDEREYIAIELEATGAEKNYVNPTSEVFFDEIEQFVWHTEEPIVSTGPYAQWCVMRLASPKVKVLLDGQAGDELLAGYVPYHYVYLKQLLRERRLGTFVREAWAARDVLKPLIKRRLGQRRKAFDERTLLRPEYLKSRRPPTDERAH